MAAAGVQAQESVNKDLDSCIRTEQIQTTAKGAALGAVAGLFKSALSGNKDVGKNVAVGAVVGGAAGFVTAYYKAVGTCYSRNPSWVPEAKIERGTDYAQTKAALRYKSEQGVVAKVVGVDMASFAGAGANVPIVTRYVALTPDGAETEVTFERHLFATLDGKEQELTFPGTGREQRTVPAGTQSETQTLPIPPGIQAGTTFRYQVSVTAAGQQPSAFSASTTVR